MSDKEILKLQEENENLKHQLFEHKVYIQSLHDKEKTFFEEIKEMVKEANEKWNEAKKAQGKFFKVFAYAKALYDYGSIALKIIEKLKSYFEGNEILKEQNKHLGIK